MQSIPRDRKAQVLGVQLSCSRPDKTGGLATGSCCTARVEPVKFDQFLPWKMTKNNFTASWKNGYPALHQFAFLVPG